MGETSKRRLRESDKGSRVAKAEWIVGQDHKLDRCSSASYGSLYSSFPRDTRLALIRRFKIAISLL